MRLLLLFSFLLASFHFTLSAQKAPDFSVVTTDAETISLYEDFLNEGKSVVVELFFVDCPTCKTFAPFMSGLHKKMEAQEIAVDFISLSVVSYDTDETVNEFKKTFDHDWYFAHAGGKSLEAAEPYIDGTYGTYFGAPTVVVIAPDGTVNYVKRIFGNNNEYIDNIETAIIDSQTAFNENSPTTAIITGGITTTTGIGLGGVEIKLTGATDTTIISAENGVFQTTNLLADESYTVSLEKNTKPVNGVTTLDIVLISKHILGIDTFTTNYQQIAADVNRSGAITTFDLVQMRQLILGINDRFPNAPSWVFDPSEVTVSNLSELGDLSFTGIKMGDLNGSASPNDLLVAEERSIGGTLQLSIADQQFEAGESVQLTMSVPDLQNIQGYQFSLVFDADFLTLNNVDEKELNQTFGGHFNLKNKAKGILSTSWEVTDQKADDLLFTLKFTAKRAGKLSEVISINSDLTVMEAFDFEEELLDLSLIFTPIKEKIIHEISLFPNPSKNTTVSVAFKAEKAEKIVLTVVNLTGQIMTQSIHQLTLGQQLINLNTTDWTAGIYTIKIEKEEGKPDFIQMIKQ